MTTAKVYAAVAAVMAEIGSSGISKDRRNQQQGYNFRGIDEVYNALSPILSKHKLCILPRILARSVTERTTQKGGVLFYVTVEAEFDLVCAEDGSIHTVRTFGEAMDSADKATNKAMSAAYKYAAMQAFCIPTEGDNDADATTHEVVPAKPAEKPAGGNKPQDPTILHVSAVNAASDLDALKAAWEAIDADQTLSQDDYDKLKLAVNQKKPTLVKPAVPANFDNLKP